MIDWLNENSGAVQGMAAIISVLVLFGLAAVTWWYAKQTKRIAESTEHQARSSAQMVREAVAGREGQIRPQILVQWVGVDIDRAVSASVPKRLDIAVLNDGRGPAINVNCGLDWPGWQFSSSLAAFDLPVDGQKTIVFGRLDEADNSVPEPKIVIEYENISGRGLRQAWRVEVESAGGFHLGEALPTEESEQPA